MNTIKLTEEAKESLVGKRIIHAGDNYIVLEDGCRIYLEESEIENLNPSNSTMFYIDGYYKDDKSEFTNYLVTEYHDDVASDGDDDVFYYGLSEADIVEAINSGENTELEFVITAYKPY